MLPLSHDEVVHGKGSLIRQDARRRMAEIRQSAHCFFGYMYAHPGKKLLFMGGEFGQVREWTHESSLEWHVLQYPVHSGLQFWVSQLNRVHREEPALHELDIDPAGFEWVDCNDHLAAPSPCFAKAVRKASGALVICNFTPVPAWTIKWACRRRVLARTVE